MTRSTQAGEKLEDFINKLESMGCEVKPVSKKPQIYRINGELVNIRSRGKSKRVAGGTGFWYNVSFSVLEEVNSVIYLMTDSDYFVKFPSSFLERLEDRMYPDSKNVGVGVFDIDWTEGYLVLKGGELEPIWDYLHGLSDPDILQVFEIEAG